MIEHRDPATAADPFGASLEDAMRWYSFSLIAADGSVGGRGRVVASSAASANRFATLFLAGHSTVRLDGETGDE